MYMLFPKSRLVCGGKRTLQLSLVLFSAFAVVGCSNLQGLSESSTTQGLSLSSAANSFKAVPTNLPAASVGKPYTAAVSAKGGVEPYDFRVIEGKLPPGLIVNAQ